MYGRITHRMMRIAMAMILAFTICCYPFVCAKKAEAFAPAVGAAAAAAALAAELGITTEALMTGLMVITAAGTGVYLLESSDFASSDIVLDGNMWGNLWNNPNVSDPGYSSNWDTEYRNYKLGNGKSWDELTDEEKANWANPAEYVQSQWLGYLLQTGMIQEVSGGGGFEPTPEPDKNQDPGENSRWNKARNVLTALGVGGGAVALNDAVGWLGDAIGGGIHDLIFGQDFIAMPYTKTYDMPDGDVIFNYWGGGHLNGYILYSDTWYAGKLTFNSGSDNGNSYYGLINGTTPDITLTHPTDYYRLVMLNNSFRIIPERNKVFTDNGNWQLNVTYPIYNNTQGFLNGNYAGTYVFPGGYTYSNGKMNHDIPFENNYDSMLETPQELMNSVNNNNTWNNYINNASEPNEQGQIKAVTVPSVLSDGLTYNDIVVTTDENDVTPIPDDGPIPTPEPEPEPGLSPGAPDGFQDEMSESVNRILRNPLDQVFPFCLIADFRDFIFLFMAGDTEIGQNTTRLQPNRLQVQSDTPTDELNGIHSLQIDFDEAMEGFEIDVPLDPLHDLLMISRVPFTVLFALALVYESFSFFLKRGGE